MADEERVHVFASGRVQGVLKTPVTVHVDACLPTHAKWFATARYAEIEIVLCGM